MEQSLKLICIVTWLTAICSWPSCGDDPVSWCTVWKGAPQDLMDHILDGHNVPREIKRASLQKLFPPWAVIREQYAESLSAQRSGISNDVLQFSEVGLSLVHHYRVHSVGRPHAMFRGKYLTQLHALLPRRTTTPTVGRPPITAAPRWHPQQAGRMSCRRLMVRRWL